MKTDIRKISVGKDYPNNVLHYQRGNRISLAGDPYVITDIVIDRELLQMGKMGYNIYIAGEDNSKVLWKQIVDVPVVVENNITFN